MSDRKVYTICAIVAALCVALLLVIGPVPPAGAAEKASVRSFSVMALCTHPDKSDADCGLVRLYISGPVRAEGERGEYYSEYLGWSRTHLPSHGDYRVVQSKIRPDRWLVYRAI
jgi:hypothetical protein